MPLNRAYDCDPEEHRSNGGGCEPLHALAVIVDNTRKRQDAVDGLVGQMLGAVSEGAKSAANAEASADRSERMTEQCLGAVQRMHSKLFGEANEVLAKYSSAPPPDYDEGEITKVQDRPTLYRRAKESEAQLKAARAKLYVAIASAITTIVGLITAYLAMRGH